jgi:TPR repeat protein
MHDINFTCNQCGQDLIVDTAGVGLSVSCPSCGSILVVPSTQPACEAPAFEALKVPPVITSPGSPVEYHQSAPEAAFPSSTTPETDTPQSSPLDSVQALKWYRKAAEQGGAEYQSVLGDLLLGNSCGQPNYEEGLFWLRKAAEQGHAHAQSNLGICYTNGHGVTKDDDQAVKWFFKAAQQGEPDAENSLAVAHWLGRGVSKDLNEAVKWWCRAAEHGHAAAQSNLSVCYQEGHGVPQDFVEAYTWMKLAALQHYEEANDNCLEIAAKMTSDQLAEASSRVEQIAFVKANPKQADDYFQDYLNLFRRIAEAGDIEAQIFLYSAYANGSGVKKDDAEAARLLRMAAEQGHLDAQVTLGNLYADGRGVPKDLTQAVTFWQKAAKRGHSDAQFYLAASYSSGIGVPQSLVESYKWANLASAQGHQDAQILRDNLAKKMPSKEIAQAQRRAIAEAANHATPPGFQDSESQQNRQAIPSDVRREIWRRDGGRCVKCGSRAALEYDHIIPVARGGSNTARNIELLCEVCNRSKRDSIQ